MTMKRTIFGPLGLPVLAISAALLVGGAPARAQLQLSQAPAQAQTPAPGQTAAEDQPATFSADEMTHDRDLGVITARGHVEVNHAGRTLLADTISYDQTNDIIRASGNVTLHMPTGEVMFADTMEVSGDLKNGLIENFRAVLADRSRFAANRAQLVNDETLTMDRAVYSPCEPCQDDPTRPLLWQLKAVKVVHDKVGQVVEYEDAWLEFAGVPIAYTPYFSHPDPTVKRKSGLLPPRVGGSSDLGMVARVPYFYAIDEYSDATFTPIITSEERGGLAAQYRDRYTKGKLDAEGSLVNDSANNILAHIDAQARFDIDRTWRVGADLRRSTTDTYMRRYGFGGDSTLTSQMFAEGFRGDNYASVKAMSFQGLRATDNSKTTPLVMPVAKFNHQGQPNRYGAYNVLDMNLAMLTRDQSTTSVGTSSTRLAIRPSWNLPYTAPKGDIYKLTATLGLDFFNAQALDAPTTYADAQGDGTYDGSALRIRPEISLDWRWPFARRFGTTTEVLEPIGQVIVSPYGGNTFKMPNEDSQDFDFNDTNLFSANRFTGYDRVESGPRANYGFKWGVYGDQGGSTSVLVGQSYRLSKDDTFAAGSGLDTNFSDYVARVKVSPGSHLDLLYRTRLDQKTLDFNRNEVGVQGNYSVFSYRADYVFFNRHADSEFTGRKELSYDFGAKLSQFWRTNISGVRDLGQDGGQRAMRLGFIYEDECFQFDTSLSRTFYQDREIKPTDAIMFRLVFKTLGEVATDVSP